MFIHLVIVFYCFIMIGVRRVQTHPPTWLETILFGVFCFLFGLAFVARATHPPSESCIFCEMELFSSYRPLDTTKITEISSRIHF